MLELTIITRTYCSVNEGCFSLVPLLLHDAPNFGNAIQRITLEPFFDDETNSVPGGSASFNEYHLELQKLPTRKFSRRNKNLTVKYFSRVCLGIDLRRKAMTRDRDALVENESARIFREFYIEMIGVLQDLRTIVRPADDFDVNLFLSYLSEKRSHLPKTNQELFQLWTDSIRGSVHLAADFAPPSSSQAMSEGQFWSLINAVDQPALERDAEHEAVRPLIEKLSKLSADTIESFQQMLTDKLYALDTLQHFRAGEETSEDAFLYCRCYVIGRGRTYYEQVVANPKLMPKDPPWFEHLLYAAAEAWADVTEDDPLHFPHNVSDKSYETGSNTQGWPTPSDSSIDS